MKERFETFTILISKLNRNIKKIKNYETSEYNLKSIHATCIYYLYINKSLTATDLCEKCSEDKSTISKALDYLEKNDYVVCQSKYKKRYNSPFILTERGNILGKKIIFKVNSVLNELDLCLSSEERMELYKNLEKISETMNNIVFTLEKGDKIND